MQLIRNIGRLFTSAGADREPGPVIEHAAVVVDGDKLAWIGRDSEIPSGLTEVTGESDMGGCLVTPGLIDAHTHPLYAGDRHSEIARRSEGASYSDIAAAGGGIAATVAATRAAPAGEIAAALAGRLDCWLAGGTTTIEAKTGYHLDEAGELEGVRLLSAQAEEGAGGGGVEITFLGGHAVGPEWEGDADAYARAVASWCAAARAAGARHVDVFCDAGYFSLEQSRLMLEAGKSAGLTPRIHADELALTGGAELAAELGCASADHLLRVDEAGIRALASGGVVATLAPITALAMGRTPPARALAEAGVTIALGSDHNPGTCGTTSMSLVIALSVAELGLSVHEAVVAATAGGARSLRLSDR
ncbi:MAG: imidazolonepropionase [Acidimicrobiales bacterium]